MSDPNVKTHIFLMNNCFLLKQVGSNRIGQPGLSGLKFICSKLFMSTSDIPSFGGPTKCHPKNRLNVCWLLNRCHLQASSRTIFSDRRQPRGFPSPIPGLSGARRPLRHSAGRPWTRTCPSPRSQGTMRSRKTRDFASHAGRWSGVWSVVFLGRCGGYLNQPLQCLRSHRNPCTCAGGKIHQRGKSKR